MTHRPECDSYNNTGSRRKQENVFVTLVRAWKMGTSCFLNRIQKARSMKEKMDELYPLLRSLNLRVGFSGGSHCFILRPLMLTDTLSGVSDGVWITVQLPHSYPQPSSAPRFLSTFDSSGVIPAVAALSPQRMCCVCLWAVSFSLPPLPFHIAPVLFILPSTFFFFSVGLWACFIFCSLKFIFITKIQHAHYSVYFYPFLNFFQSFFLLKNL